MTQQWGSSLNQTGLLGAGVAEAGGGEGEAVEHTGLFAAVMVCISVLAMLVIIAWFQCRFPLIGKYRRLRNPLLPVYTDAAIVASLEVSEADEDDDDSEPAAL